MTEIDAKVSADGQRETTNGQSEERGRSKIAFPYLHLEGCIEIAQAVHTVGGHACEWNQVAAQAKQSAKGGAFRQKMLSARVFGLLEYKGQHVELTPIGQRSLDPQTTKLGRVQAFLTVPLFRRMYEQLEGQLLPPHAAIQHQMESAGVAPKQTEKARQVFLRSARDAGFFEINSDRLAKPSTSDQPEQSGGTGVREKQTADHRTSGGESEGRLHHPLIEALLAQMPPPGTKWEQARCVMWLQAILLSLGMIYEDFDELRDIEISVRQQ